MTSARSSAASRKNPVATQARAVVHVPSTTTPRDSGCTLIGEREGPGIAAYGEGGGSSRPVSADPSGRPSVRTGVPHDGQNAAFGGACDPHALHHATLTR